MSLSTFLDALEGTSGNSISPVSEEDAARFEFVIVHWVMEIHNLPIIFWEHTSQGPQGPRIVTREPQSAKNREVAIHVLITSTQETGTIYCPLELKVDELDEEDLIPCTPEPPPPTDESAIPKDRCYLVLDTNQASEAGQNGWLSREADGELYQHLHGGLNQHGERIVLQIYIPIATTDEVHSGKNPPQSSSKPRRSEFANQGDYEQRVRRYTDRKSHARGCRNFEQRDLANRDRRGPELWPCYGQYGSKSLYTIQSNDEHKKAKSRLIHEHHEHHEAIDSRNDLSDRCILLAAENLMKLHGVPRENIMVVTRDVWVRGKASAAGLALCTWRELLPNILQSPPENIADAKEMIRRFSP